MAAQAAISSTSLAVTLAHAVSYLTNPLATSPSSPYSATTIATLQAALEANLASTYVNSWCPQDPLRGSGRRCLTFAPGALPPRPVYAACRTAGVDWPEWMRCLGSREFDLFVDPGCVSVRLGATTPAGHYQHQPGSTTNVRARLVTVWSEELEAQQNVEAQIEALRLKQRELELQQQALQLQAQQAELQGQQQLFASTRRGTIVPITAKPKTLAQRLMETDGEEDDALFSLLADEISQPTWMTPIIEQFPVVPVPLKRTAAAFVPAPKHQAERPMTHSRSSSRSSVTSSSGFSFISDDSTVSSCASLSSVDSSLDAKSTTSRRQRAREARVFIDTTKKEVTPYDGGKTTVLTGGVMLGAAPRKVTTTNSQRRF